MLIAAIDELATGDVIGYLLSFPELSGQGPLPRRHHLEREHVLVLDLGRVVLGQCWVSAGSVFFGTPCTIICFNMTPPYILV